MAVQPYQELVGLVAQTPEAIRQLVSGLAPDQLNHRPSAEGWSVLEHVCHLRDIEQEGYAVRIDRMLGLDHPFLPDLDGDRLAAERDYNHQPFEPALHAFIAARERNLGRLRGLSDEQMNRRAVFENVGTITLARLVGMMAEHDREHIRQLTALREQTEG